MQITILQPQQFLNQKEKNLTHLAKMIANVKEQPDIIILPESFSTGFSSDTKELAEEMDWETVARMRNQAKQKKCALCWSSIIKEKNKYFNRFLFVQPNWDIATYDKRHLFTMSNEAKFTSPGKETLLISYKWWTIAPFICYDLRFPVRSRNTQKYDLAIYVANRPDTRIQHRQKLLQARAIENQCFVIGVNAVWLLEKNRTNGWSSMIINAQGEILYQASCTQEDTKTIDIDKKSQEAYRKSFPVLEDQDTFRL